MIKSIIVATTCNHIIGYAGQLPWHLPNDLQHFKKLTQGHHVIMGRKTFESLPNTLPGRKVIVLTHNTAYPTDHILAADMTTALAWAQQANETEVFIAGGSTVYAQVLPWVDKIYMTRIHANMEGDVFFPLLDSGWQEMNKTSYRPDAQHAYAYDLIELTRP